MMGMFHHVTLNATRENQFAEINKSSLISAQASPTAIDQTCVLALPHTDTNSDIGPIGSNWNRGCLNSGANEQRGHLKRHTY